MKIKEKFFFFGFGQTAKYFVSELLRQKRNFTFLSTNTKKTKAYYFKKKRFVSFKFKDNLFDKEIKKNLLNSNFVLISIPPQKTQDVVLKNFAQTLKDSKIKKIIYLSATSVYGNHNGKWVNESSKLKGKTFFGSRRKKIEKLWLNFKDKTKKDVNILRVAGIYSKESNVLKKIKRSNILVKEKKYFSRIRIEDLARIINKLFLSKEKSLILNASDDKPSTNTEVAYYAAKLLKIKKLNKVSILSFKNKMIKEFYKDSKKVSNKRMKSKLKIKLKYPTYKEGLNNIFRKSI